MNKSTTCSFTGHRLTHFDFTHSELGRRLIDLLDAAILVAAHEGYTTFLTGMAMGFDIVAAERVLVHKARGLDVSLVSVLPFRFQHQKYPPKWRRRFEDVLLAADDAVILNENFIRGCYQARNKWLVDNANHLICYFNGKPSGTAHTYKLAMKAGIDIVNIWDESFSEDIME